MNDKFKKYIAVLSKYEYYFFLLLTAINLLPLLLFESFPTVDGPAHLYNSRIIIELTTDNTSLLSDYFMFNQNINPNWSGHFILSSLMFLFPALIAEKILIIAYLIFLPLSFRFVFNKLKLKQTYIIYFIFPFTYSFLLYYGFYNFQLGLIFFFLAIGYWEKYLDSGFKLKKIWILITLSLLIFFSHLFIFMMLICVIGYLNLDLFLKLIKQKEEVGSLTIKSILLQFTILLPGIILMLIYLWTHPTLEGKPNYLGYSELWTMLQEIQPAKGVSYGKESVFMKWVFIILSLISAFLLIRRIRNKRVSINKKSASWLIISISILIGFFTLPDSTAGSVGFVSSRMLLFFFLFYIIFLGSVNVPVWIKTVAFLTITYVNFALIKIYVKETKKVNQISHEIIQASYKIKNYSTVLPINDNRHWINGHISNYLGIDRPMIILENYEASLNHFPLIWNRNKSPYLHLGDSMKGSGFLYTNQNDSMKQIDYVFILSEGANDTIGNNEKQITTLLEKYYDLSYKSNENIVRLYMKK